MERSIGKCKVSYSHLAGVLYNKKVILMAITQVSGKNFTMKTYQALQRL